jgi:Flp pilus assembly protein TadD
MSNKSRVQLLINSGNIEKAKELCLKLCHQEQKDSQLWMMLGFTQLRSGDPKNAEIACRKALALNPNELDAWNCLSHVLYEQKRYVEAEKIIRKLSKHNLGLGVLHYQLALVLYAQKKLDDAEKHFLTAIQLGGAGILANMGYANLLYDKGDYFEAMEQCKAVLTFDNANAEAFFKLGLLYDLTGQLNKAVESLREAIKLIPNKCAFYTALAKAYRQSGMQSESEKAFRKALELEPENSDIHHSLAICLFDDQDLTMSESAFKRAIELNAENELAKCYLSIIRTQMVNNSKSNTLRQANSVNCPLVNAIVDSFEYSSKANPNARYFGTTPQMLEYAIDAVSIDGLYLEFGVCFGSSITIIANKSGNEVHGFDSFSGLPEAWDVGQSAKISVEVAASYSTKGRLPSTPDNVQLHVGFFEESLPVFVGKHTEPVAFMNIDCDLYSSTDTIFRNFEKQIVSGTIIVFDEYFCYTKWRDHEYKAFQEFLERTGLSYRYLAFSYFTGQAIVQIL